MHPVGVADSDGSRHTHSLHHPLQHDGRPTRDGNERESAGPERDNQADTSKECPPRQIVGRSRPDGAVLPRGRVLRWNPLRQA